MVVAITVIHLMWLKCSLLSCEFFLFFGIRILLAELTRSQSNKQMHWQQVYNLRGRTSAAQKIIFQPLAHGQVLETRTRWVEGETCRLHHHNESSMLFWPERPYEPTHVAAHGISRRTLLFIWIWYDYNIIRHVSPFPIATNKWYSISFSLFSPFTLKQCVKKIIKVINYI
jgi:hypothetical protein